MTTTTAITTTAVDLAGDFRDAMAHLCAPVSVITAMDDGRPHGTTVSAVMSLSLQPLLIAVSLARTSDCLAIIRDTGAFGVNILGADQGDIALQFATKGRNKFGESGWTTSTDVPRLDGSAVWLACTLAGDVTGGDHQILFGEVAEVSVRSGAAPLTYHNRCFGTHTAHGKS